MKTTIPVLLAVLIPASLMAQEPPTETLEDWVALAIATPDGGELPGGVNMFRDADAADAIYRVYIVRRADRRMRHLGSLTALLGAMPDGVGLPYLAEIAQEATSDLTPVGPGDYPDPETDPHFGLWFMGLDAMIQMTQAPAGRARILELDRAGTLDRFALERIRYNEAGDHICAAVPELSACRENAELGYSRGHPTADVCEGIEGAGYHACRDAFWEEMATQCADEVSGSVAAASGHTLHFRTYAARACRDDVMRKYLRQRPGG